MRNGAHGITGTPGKVRGSLAFRRSVLRNRIECFSPGLIFLLCLFLLPFNFLFLLFLKAPVFAKLWIRERVDRDEF